MPAHVCTYLQTYVQIQKNILACTDALNKHTGIYVPSHKCIRTYIHTYIYTNIHTYVQTHIHTYIYTYRHTHMVSNALVAIYIMYWLMKKYNGICIVPKTYNK